MEKTFDPKSYEARWQSRWAAKGYFTARVDDPRPAYTIMIPPPNVTGKLHMGHALQYALQDLLTRWRRMQGRNALWLPGTDHAGPATQLMVERELAKDGKSRKDFDREAFLEIMWAWKEKYHGNIRRQMDRLGASCDWSRERFTLDEGLSVAVREAFVQFYAEKLIYRGDYIVNWSPGLDSAISDLEVEMRSVEDRLWQVAYPVEGSDERVVVATTRPETILGDTAVAYHPDDARYRHLEGRRAIVPVAGRSIPFVADDKVEKEFGTGLVKVTPFHDPADFELARRHGLPGISVIDRHARMTAEAGADFTGLDVEAARAKILTRLRADGLLVRDERYVHNVGFCQRSGVRVQPLVSTQWFCDVSGMAREALAAWRDGRVAFVPAAWGKTWEHWLENIRPWCISRQVWWGHRIPAWYDKDGKIFVARSREEAAALAGTGELTQDPDVLDTWFSSGLWPFSTLGWPEKTKDFAVFYPTDVLVTGFDILFFWVARMVMMGLHLTGRSPFAIVHLTGLIRDAEGQKMSKTKGNVLDPEELIDEYGADAVRFTLALLASPGRDIPLDAERMAGYRAFGNKIWNATRFALARTEGAQVQVGIDPSGLDLPERWILHSLSKVAAEIDANLEEFRFDQACMNLYSFFWSDFCDWYIEAAKSSLAEGSEKRLQVGDVLLTVLDRALRLLHPVMPFLTEELWQKLPGRESIHAETICLAPYPKAEPRWLDDSAAAEFGEIQSLVTAIRNDRSAAKLDPRSRCRLLVASQSDPTFAFLRTHQVLLRDLCGVDRVERDDAPVGTVHLVRGGRVRVDFLLPELLSGARGAEDAAKLEEQLEELRAQIARAEARLAEPGFLAKAPESVVAGNRKKLVEMTQKAETLESRLAVAKGAGA